MTTIRAIETRYAGCHFRSRLEARWAVFFDHLGIQWEYEPEGFELPAGRYLPDFWLPGLSTWFEVKPGLPDGWFSSPPGSELDPRWSELADLTGHRHIAAFGLPSLNETHSWRWGSGIAELWHNGGNDYGYQFCICFTCSRIGIEFEGRWGRICNHPGDWADDSHSGNHPLIVDAYTAARSARFEHGQSGATE